MRSILSRSAIVYLFIACISISVDAQSIYDQFAVVQYGNTFEQPFYRATDIHQDSLNRLIFTGRDMIRFDGEEFVKLSKDIRGEYLGQDTLHGVEWYKPDLFTANCYRGDSLYLSINTKDYVEYNFHYIYQDKDQTYLVTNSGLIEFRWADNDLAYVQTILISGQDFYALIKISDTLYCSTKEGIKYKTYADLSTEYLYNSRQSLSPLLIPGNRLVLSRKNHKHVYSIHDYSIVSEGRVHNALMAIDPRAHVFLVDSKDRVWYMPSDPSKGLHVYLPYKSQSTEVNLRISDTYNIRDIYEDHEGNIWIGTHDDGLFLLYESNIQVLDKTSGMSADNLWSISQASNGDTYIAGECAGIDIIKKDGTMDHMAENNCQRSVLVDRQDRVWINTYGIHLYEDGVFQRSFRRKDGLYSRTGKCLFEDSRGDIWVGTRKAIHKYEDGRFRAFVIDTLADFNRVFNIIELDDGSLLLALSDGEFFTFKNGKFTAIPSPTRLTSNLLKDKEGRIWISTFGDGMYKYMGGRIVAIKHSSLPDNITFIQEDLQGNIWALCHDNTIRYTSKSELWNGNNPKINTLTISDGLPLINNNIRIQPASALLDDGKIFFPNIHGAIVIRPEELHQETKDYHTIIEYNDSTYVMGSTVSLPKGSNDIRLRIHNISMHPNDHYVYEYTISNDEWIRIDDPSNVSINNLPYGINQIKFRSKDTSGDWKENTITIEAPTPFYLKWWFVLLALSLFIYFISSIIRWRTTKVRLQNEELQQKVSEQTKEIENEKEQLALSLEKEKHLTQELHLIQESKNRMYAQISHEFKSPLQAISAYLATPASHIADEDKDRIFGNIKQLLQTSTEIMDLSKAESGNLRLRPEYYNINNIIQEQIDLKQGLIQKKGLKVHFHASHKRQYILCDISLIQKVISNLLSNAIKFSKVESSITVKSEVQHKLLEVSIADQGMGIPSEDIDKLTLAYYQASNNIVPGTGIGLSLVERILMLHDSTLRIKSEIGTGSIFSFQLPLPPLPQNELEKKYSQQVDIDSQLDKIINHQKPTILIVDDNLDMLHYIKQSLSKYYNVIASNSGLQVLQKIDSINPNLIISDINMPIMSGIELLTQVRELHKYEGMPFLLLTGSISEETEISGLQSGADYVLQKPIDEEYLNIQIKQIIKRQNKVLDIANTSIANGLLPPHIADDDLKLMREVERFIIEQIDNPKLKSADIANAMNLGEKTLRNKVKSISGFTVKEYLKNFRLERAKILLEEGYGTKTEVAAAVGFSSLSYFSKSYKAYFADS